MKEKTLFVLLEIAGSVSKLLRVDFSNTLPQALIVDLQGSNVTKMVPLGLAENKGNIASLYVFETSKGIALGL